MRNGGEFRIQGRVRGPTAHARYWAVFAVWFVVAGVTNAGILSFDSQVNAREVTVGDPIQLVLRIKSDTDISSVRPSKPDFGGLELLKGPSIEQSQTYSNRIRSVEVSHRYTLAANRPGKYVIGSSEFEYQGQRYFTKFITLQVVSLPANIIPGDLPEEEIAHPLTNNAEVNRQLRGHIFVRSEVSDTNPFVGQPVVLSYTLYQDAYDRPRAVRMAPPILDSWLSDKEFHAESLDQEELVRLDGRTFRKTLLYRVALTPTRPGENRLEGFVLRFQLPVKRSGRRNSAGSLLFDNSIEALTRAQPKTVTIRPLPREGRSKNFSGTVGEFTMVSEVDKKTAKTDDMLTLTVVLAGRGDVAVASAPKFPDSDDFELFDQTQRTEKMVFGEDVLGTKTFEYLLRPARAGTLKLPVIAYETFDPARESYVAMATAPVTIHVAPGAGDGAEVAEVDPSALPDVEEGFRYIVPIFPLTRLEPTPLTESFLYWFLQVFAFALVGAGLLKNRFVAAPSAAQRRRRAAWRGLDKKLKKVLQLQADSKGSEGVMDAAFALEKGLRAFIGDWFDLGAGGLTNEEVRRLLETEDFDPEQVNRLTDILDRCEQIRYSPLAPTGAEFGQWATEARAILEAGLKS